MISVGVDNRSFLSQISQSADSKNDENIPDENDIVAPDIPTPDEAEKADPVYSQENLELKEESARIHFKKIYEEPVVPQYNTMKIFDVVKIITSTIMGEPRLTFLSPRFERHFYAKNKVAAVRGITKDALKEKFLYVVDTTGLEKVSNEDINYVENISYDGKDFRSIPEVAKLLNKYGEFSLKMIAGLLIKKDGSGANDPVKNKVRVSYAKLAVALGKYERDIKETLGLLDDGAVLFGSTERKYKSNFEIDFSKFTGIAEIYDRFKADPGIRIEFSDVISYLYFGLAAYLTGALLNLADKAGVTIATLYDKATSQEGAKTFIDRVSSVVDDKETENKLFSLFYTFFLIHNFYETNSSQEIDDVFVLPICTIGAAIAAMDEKVFDEELIDITELTHADLPEYKLTFRAYLDTPSFFKDSAYAVSLIPEYDIPSRSFVASKVFDIFTISNPGFDDEEKQLAPLCGIALANTKVDDYTETNVEKFYFFFLHSIIDELPQICSPRNFYKIALAATVFRVLKFYTKGDAKEIASLGLYQAEGYLVFLYREWFQSGKLYKIEDSVKHSDNDSSHKSLLTKARIYCDQILSELSFEATYLTPEEGRNREIRTFELDYHRRLNSIESYIELIPTDYPKGATVFGVSNENAEDYFDFIKSFNKGEISLINLFVDGKESQNLFRVNQTLENDYNQETIDKLSELKNGEDSDTEMISRLLLSKCVAKHIKEIIKNEANEERFNVFFNVFLKGTGMVVLAKDSYIHLLTDQKENTLFIGKDTTDAGNDNYLSLLPHVQSMRTFNFLNRS